MPLLPCIWPQDSQTSVHPTREWLSWGLCLRSWVLQLPACLSSLLWSVPVLFWLFLQERNPMYPLCITLERSLSFVDLLVAVVCDTPRRISTRGGTPLVVCSCALWAEVFYP